MSAERVEMKLPREEAPQLRVIFTFSLTEEFYSADVEHVNAMVEAITGALDDLAGRFGVVPLAGIDEDLVHVGYSSSPGGGLSIIADAPTLDAVIAVCNVLRETPVLEYRLWKYSTVEVRIGRPLLLGTR